MSYKALSSTPVPGTSRSTAAALTFPQTENRLLLTGKRKEQADGTKEFKLLKAEDSSSDDEDASLGELVFSKQKVLRKIFQHSTFSQVKSNRLVNRLWNIEALKALQDFFIMKPIHLSNTNTAVVNLNNLEPTRSRRGISIKKFQKFFEKTRNFPCSSFQVRNMPLTPNMIEFLNKHGSFVKTLTVIDHTSHPEEQKSRNFLQRPSQFARFFPNLEQLTLTCKCYIKYDALEFPTYDTPESELPNLKRLNIDTSYSISGHFLLLYLKMATNLEEIYWENCSLTEYEDCLKSVVRLGRAPLMKNIHLLFKKSVDFTSCKLYQNIADLCTSLKRIEAIHFDDPSPVFCNEWMIGKVLSKLFWKNAKTLESMTDIYPMSQFKDLQLPEFPRLSQLGILYDFDGVAKPPDDFIRVFPTNVNWAKTFPLLKKFKLGFTDLGQMKLEEYFEGQVMPLISVEYLEVSTEAKCCIPTNWVRHFPKLFPNVRKVKYTQVSLTDCQYVWSFENLEEVELSINLSARNDTFESVDSVFTGFSPETVLELYNVLEAGLDLREIDIDVKSLKGKSCIGNLKRLRQLFVIFDDFSLREEEDDESEDEDADANDAGIFEARESLQNVLRFKNNVILSHVTTKFGFDTCPLLESPVRIAFRTKNDSPDCIVTHDLTVSSEKSLKSKNSSQKPAPSGFTTMELSPTENSLPVGRKRKERMDDTIDKKMIKIEAAHNQESSSDEEEKSVEEIVFSKPGILMKIFHHLTFSEVKSYRQINRIWNTEASKALQTYFEMQPIYIKDTNIALVFQLNRDRDPHSRITAGLNSFQKLLTKSNSSSSIFPCSAFEIPDDPLTTSMTNFLRAHGTIVKSLTISSPSKTHQDQLYEPEVLIPRNEKRDKTLLESPSLFAEFLPNLEQLTLPRDMDNYSPDEFEESQLKNLKTLKMYFTISREFMQLYLKMAKGLTEIYWKSCSPTDYNYGLHILADLNALSLLKNIQFCFNDISNELLGVIAKTCTSLKKIKPIHFHQEEENISHERIGSILSELFSQNSKTLESITDIYPLSQITDLQLPEFPELSKLGILYNFSSSVKSVGDFARVFPPSVGVSWANIFPSLKKFKLGFSDLKQMKLEESFEGQETPLVSVEDLEVSTEEKFCIPTVWVKNFCKLFPNVKRVKYIQVALADCEYVWSFQKLEKLEILINLSLRDDSFASVDSVFTGFSRETVMKLFRKLPSFVNVSGPPKIDEENEALRVKPFIGNLKNLRQLFLKFGDFSLDEKEDDKNEDGCDNEYTGPSAQHKRRKQIVLKVRRKVIMSHVTTLFGFRMCPQLQSPVLITFENGPDVQYDVGRHILSSNDFSASVSCDLH